MNIKTNENKYKPGETIVDQQLIDMTKILHTNMSHFTQMTIHWPNSFIGLFLIII